MSKRFAGFVLAVAVICAGIKIDGLLKHVPPPVIAPPHSPWLWGVEDGVNDFGTVYVPNRVSGTTSGAWK
jgi:hypothetical protein